jgi:hypothetical protein
VFFLLLPVTPTLMYEDMRVRLRGNIRENNIVMNIFAIIISIFSLLRISIIAFIVILKLN